MKLLLLDGKEITFDEWLEASTENIAADTFTGFAAGVAFEAVHVAAGTPKPENAAKVQKGVTEDGLTYKDYLDKYGNIIARDIKASDAAKFLNANNNSTEGIIEYNPDKANMNAGSSNARTIRFTFDYANKTVSQNGNVYDVDATLMRGYQYDWADNALFMGQKVV